jgi:hypothetical protein
MSEGEKKSQRDEKNAKPESKKKEWKEEAEGRHKDEFLQMAETMIRMEYRLGYCGAERIAELLKTVIRQRQFERLLGAR